MALLTKLAAASFQADLTAQVRNHVRQAVGTGAPSDGTSGTGAGFAGPGSTYVDIDTGHVYLNIGTKFSPAWNDLSVVVATDYAAGSVDSAAMDPGLIKIATGTITSANITGTSAGQLGHANGVELVASPGAGVVCEFISAILINDFGVAAYTGGGNTTINIGGGGAALSGLVSNANFIQSAADKIIYFNPLAATFLTLTANTGINLVTASAPTQPGTAAGVFRYAVKYRLHATGL